MHEEEDEGGGGRNRCWKVEHRDPEFVLIRTGEAHLSSGSTFTLTFTHMLIHSVMQEKHTLWHIQCDAMLTLFTPQV